MIRFYNTQSREFEPFQPLEENTVKMYACGPTVYNYFHIGNARCFVLFDMLRRYLEYRGYAVNFVQNFTDIDDKMIRRAQEEGTTVKEVATRYINEYFTDAKGLGVRPATTHPLATDNMEEIIKIISDLMEKGHAYAVDGDVYFRTLSFPGYGKLSHAPIDDLMSGARIEVGEKKENPLDFALWKACKPGEPFWESPWGKGRPGWHIECSAMTRRYLGEQIDIHCGGQDLTFPHHENEIAQSEASSGKPFVKYWLHNGYINVDNKKMSKSLNNFFTVRDVAKEYGYAPIRFFLLSAHYRTPINYSREILEQAQNALSRLYNCTDNLQFYLQNIPATNDAPATETVAKLQTLRTRFIEAMDNDFNTADGISVLFDLVREINTALAAESKPAYADAKAMQDLLLEWCDLLGFVKEETQDTDKIAQIEAAIAERAQAKKEKNYAKADAIRAELLAQGVILEDTAQGTKYRFAD